MPLLQFLRVYILLCFFLGIQLKLKCDKILIFCNVGFPTAHQAVVTAAIFAPQPGLIIKSQFQYEDSDEKTGPPEVRGEVIVSADFNGAIKVFINKFKPGAGM